MDHILSAIGNREFGNRESGVVNRETANVKAAIGDA